MIFNSVLITNISQICRGQHSWQKICLCVQSHWYMYNCSYKYWYTLMADHRRGQPFTVTTRVLFPAEFLCSHSHSPCQVPRLNFPLLMGILTPVPMKAAFTWAGISSGPSQLCLKGVLSGISLFIIISMSTLTSGSQFSFRHKLAEVCLMWTLAVPILIFCISGTWWRTSSVMRWHPRFLAEIAISLWYHTLPSPDWDISD